MISRGPREAMAPLTARFNSSALLVSPWKALACPAAFLMRPAVSSAELPSRSIAATGEPFPASANAMARPMPEPAPVTMAIRLFGAIDVGSSSFAKLFAQLSPRRSRRASQLEGRPSPAVGRREVERTLLLEGGCGYQTAMA